MKATSKKRCRSSQKRSPKNPRILVVDSDTVMAELMRSYLGDEKGYEVLIAETGASGIRAALEQLPDLILVDFRLADMSGLEMHDRLRQNPATKEIPVIYVSSFLTLRTIEKATDKGARGFISKPFTLSEIYTKVATILSSSI
ncbi:MAG: response regulator [Candidatus Abyssobacteria bacterium SURF_17]|jgi:CheY-like chemotaxis protein|uniref:Response regulator n=1 Tax=Candidatus Abyssobacteria bacterium SURF_17 TaxID=2093361 RepID=A0A419EZC0_9BACT|nr:MAG: response regulator [Candidatus Abyssubacteria bacterium SURF_17]